METPDHAYTPAQRTLILRLARAALEEHLGQSSDELAADAGDPCLLDHRGCFVTLRNAGALRGCIGTFAADRPLLDTVTRMAAGAAEDPRFTDRPVTAAELPELTLEVSVLTPMQPIDDPLAMRIGVDGIYLRRAARVGPAAVSGCFLPEVAAEQGWDPATTLAMCCAHKMKLPSDAWQTLDDMEFFVFQSLKLREANE